MRGKKKWGRSAWDLYIIPVVLWSFGILMRVILMAKFECFGLWLKDRLQPFTRISTTCNIKLADANHISYPTRHQSEHTRLLRDSVLAVAGIGILRFISVPHRVISNPNPTLGSIGCLSGLTNQLHTRIHLRSSIDQFNDGLTVWRILGYDVLVCPMNDFLTGWWWIDWLTQ